MMTTVRATIVIALGLSVITCRDKTVDIIDNTPPGRRDYTWTVDTLKANPGDQIYLSSLWGSSPADVWAVGLADASNIAKWHYDGVTWRRDPSRLSSNLRSVFGFAQNDVWACDGPGGNIFHYDGSQWSLFGYYTLPGYSFLSFSDLWGDAPNNIYALGTADSSDGKSYKGVIMHYDGARWSFVSIPDQRISFGRIRKSSFEWNTYYVFGERLEPTGDTVKLFRFDGRRLKEIYSSQDEPRSFNLINNIIYFNNGKQILYYKDTSFTIWRDFSSTGFLVGALYGRSEKDIFSETYKSGKYGLLHFNGTDLKMLYETPGPIFDVFLFPSHILIVTDDGTNPIVVHGVLK